MAALEHSLKSVATRTCRKGMSGRAAPAGAPAAVRVPRARTAGVTLAFVRTLRDFVLASAVLAISCSRAPTEWRAGFVDAPVAAVASQTTGRVETISVREGDHVARGQLLAPID